MPNNVCTGVKGSFWKLKQQQQQQNKNRKQPKLTWKRKF